MLCISHSDLGILSSAYFCGFLPGLILFMLPIQLGQMKTMYFVMILYIIACYLVLFESDIYLISFGFFLQGFLHIKIMLSYSHMYDFTNEANKAFCSTFIGIFDILVISLQGAYYLFIDKDVVYFC